MDKEVKGLLTAAVEKLAIDVKSVTSSDLQLQNHPLENSDNFYDLVSVSDPVFSSAAAAEVSEESTEEADTPRNETHMSRSKEITARAAGSENCGPTVAPIIRDTYDVDITTRFRSNCISGLRLGQLITTKNFGLIDAMSAIELMDPKMDAGMQVNQLTDPYPLTFECLKMSHFTVSEYIGLFDETLACLSTWLDGQPIMQTLYTNVYLSDPLSIEDRTLRVMMSAFISIAILARRIIHYAGVYVEEDFQCNLYDKAVDLMNEHDCIKSATAIKELEDDLHRMLKAEQRNTPQEKDRYELDMALYSRVRFLRFFGRVLTSVIPGKVVPAEVDDKFEMYVREALEQLDVSVETVCLGLQIKDCSRYDKHNKKLMMGYDASFAKNDLPPTYPRPVLVMSRSSGYEFLRCTVSKLTTVRGVFGLSIHDSLCFMIDFGRKDSCILSRSILQCLYVYRIENSSFPNFLNEVKETVRQFIHPPSLQKLPGVEKSMLPLPPGQQRQFDHVINQAADYFLSCFKVAGHHESRQRANWAELMTQLASFQDDANQLDNAIHEQLSTLPSSSLPISNHLACYGTWALYESLLNMIRYTTDGFFIKLYSVHEYRYIYWYLYNCIYGWLKSTFIRADDFINSQNVVLDNWNKQKRKTKKRKRPSCHVKELTMCQAIKHLYDAFFRAITGFTIGNKIKYPKFDFDCEGVRFKHRFLVFKKLVAFPVIHYEQFKTCIDTTENTRFSEFDLYESALKAFSEVRGLLETIEQTSEVKLLINICKRNAIVMNLLTAGHRSQAPPTFDFHDHPTFPVIKIN